jgi:hypothetical protein
MLLGETDLVRTIKGERGIRPMRIHVGKPELVPELMRYFEEQADCVVLQVAESEIEVSLLGSYRHDRHEAAVERLLAGFWLEADDTPRPAEARASNGNGNGNGNGKRKTPRRPASA